MSKRVENINEYSKSYQHKIRKIIQTQIPAAFDNSCLSDASNNNVTSEHDFSNILENSVTKELPVNNELQISFSNNIIIGNYY